MRTLEVINKIKRTMKTDGIIRIATDEDMEKANENGIPMRLPSTEKYIHIGSYNINN